MSVHAAHYFALRGYKVLLADYDPQGSATAYHFTEHAPIDRAALANRAYLLGDEHSIETAIIPTHIPNLHLIPATIRLHDCDIALSLDLAQVTNQRLYRMKRGIHHLARHYDLIFIDGPPALASIGLSILATATVLLIPMHPSMIDCASTGHLLHVLLSYTHSASIELGPYHLIKIVTNGGTTRTNSTEALIRDKLREVFQDALFTNHMIHSAEITAASTTFQSIYETRGPQRHTRTRKRCIAYLDAFNSELHHYLAQPSLASRRVA